MARDLDIPLFPQIIIFREDSFRDDTEIDTPPISSEAARLINLAKDGCTSTSPLLSNYSRVYSPGKYRFCHRTIERYDWD